jgi:hypothetical protein
MESSNLLRELRKAANKLLNGEGIYPILNYGWEDHDTPSGEYVGLAMWTTTGPFEPDLGIWERTTPPINPTKRDEILYTAGEDFVGTMELARNSFGMTLYSWQHRKSSEVLDDEELFWEHHASTVLWLNIASDRLRDFFTMARFGMAPEKYKDAYPRNRGYADPFRMRQSNEGELASKAAVTLQPLAEQLGAFRATRNKIVHEIASRDGRNAATSIALQRQEAQQTSTPPRPLSIPDFEKSKEIIKALEEEKQSELRTALQQLREWYLLLIRAGSLVFEFEYWKRINR